MRGADWVDSILISVCRVIGWVIFLTYLIWLIGKCVLQGFDLKLHPSVFSRIFEMVFQMHLYDRIGKVFDNHQYGFVRTSGII